MSSIAIGVGCRKGCPAQAIETLIRQAIGLAPTSETLGLFTLEDKRGELGMVQAANHLGFGIVYLSREALLERADAVLTPSQHAEKLFGVPSVAEAAALAGAGPGSILIVPRIAAGGVTCAIAGFAP